MHIAYERVVDKRVVSLFGVSFAIGDRCCGIRTFLIRTSAGTHGIDFRRDEGGGWRPGQIGTIQVSARIRLVPGILFVPVKPFPHRLVQGLACTLT